MTYGSLPDNGLSWTFSLSFYHIKFWILMFCRFKITRIQLTFSQQFYNFIFLQWFAFSWCSVSLTKQIRIYSTNTLFNMDHLYSFHMVGSYNTFTYCASLGFVGRFRIHFSDILNLSEISQFTDELRAVFCIADCKSISAARKLSFLTRHYDVTCVSVYMTEQTTTKCYVFLQKFNIDYEHYDKY